MKKLAIRSQQTWRVETAYLHAGLPQALPEAPGGLAEGTEPVIDEPDLHPLAGLCAERFREFLSCIIVVDDIGLEVDPLPGGSDRFEPRGVVLSRVLQEPDAVAGYEVGPRCPGKKPLGERAQRRDPLAHGLFWVAFHNGPLFYHRVTPGTGRGKVPAAGTDSP